MQNTAKCAKKPAKILALLCKKSREKKARTMYRIDLGDSHSKSKIITGYYLVVWRSHGPTGCDVLLKVKHRQETTCLIL